jgi:hypothetical protein
MVATFIERAWFGGPMAAMGIGSMSTVYVRFTSGGRRRAVSEFLCGALMAALLVAPLVVVLLAWIIPETDDDPNF